MAHRRVGQGRVRLSCVAVAATAALGWAVPSQAAFPGANGRLAFDYDQQTTPDGSPGTSVTSREIWTSNPDGTDRRRLTSNLASDSDPTYSPDGRWIAFVSDRTGTSQIFVMRDDGSGQRQVTRAAGGATQPAWSPAGLLLVYVHAGDLWTISPTGLFARPLMRTPNVAESAPAWSPKGLRIAYTAAAANPVPGDRTHSIWTVRIDGKDARNLSAVTAPGVAVEDADPDWSPDGSWIAFDTHRGNTWTINGSGVWEMRADGTDPHVLLEGGHYSGSGVPVFSPDGREFADGGGEKHTGSYIEVARLGVGDSPATIEFTNFGGPGEDYSTLQSPSWQPVRR